MTTDPAILATLVTTMSFLGSEVARGAASEAGKTIWGRVRVLLGWAADPPPDKLKQEAETRLASDPTLAAQLVTLLKAYPSEPVAQLVGHINAEKVVVAQTIHAQNFTL